ncbi:MAG: hypothetical protein WBO73_20260 [Gammaproteobacteria bacterium]|jgi:uncharacterized spore protein YtfJ
MTSLRATEIFHDSRRLLIAIESVDYSHRKTTTGGVLQLKIEPVAVIVCSPDGIYALDMEARSTLVEPLRKDIPELDAIMASFESG